MGKIAYGVLTIQAMMLIRGRWAEWVWYRVDRDRDQDHLGKEQVDG